jgi:hypothetical protein
MMVFSVATIIHSSGFSMNVAHQRAEPARGREPGISAHLRNAVIRITKRIPAAAIPGPRQSSRAWANASRYCDAGRRMGQYRRPTGQGFPAEVSTTNSLIKLQILLRRQCRTPEAADEVRKILLSLGLKPTAVGLATLSADAEPSRFESLFGMKATEILPQPPGKTDFGASGGHVSPDLPVPGPLQPYVESISAAPPHTYLQR